MTTSSEVYWLTLWTQKSQPTCCRCMGSSSGTKVGAAVGGSVRGKGGQPIVLELFSCRQLQGSPMPLEEWRPCSS